MKLALALAFSLAALPAMAQTDAGIGPKRAGIAPKPVKKIAKTVAPAQVAQPYNPLEAAEKAALYSAVPGKDGIKRMVILRGLDKMTGRAQTLFVPVGRSVQYATRSFEGPQPTVSGRPCGEK